MLLGSARAIAAVLLFASLANHADSKMATGGTPYPDRYYELLGLERNNKEKGVPSAKDVKKAYRKLSLELHPDKVSSEKQAAAKQQLDDVQLAYDVLSDPERRKHYDKYGFDEIDEDCEYPNKNVDFYEGSKTVVQLTPKNFPKIQEQVHITWVVEWYAPWCAPCRVARLEYRKLAQYWATKPEAKVRVAAVNCEKQKQLCNQNNVFEFPSIWVFPKGKRGQPRPRPELFPHPDKTLEQLVEFIEPLASNSVIELDMAKSSYANVVEAGKLPAVVAYGIQYCGPCQMLEGPLRAFASKMKGEVVVAHVDCTEGSASFSLCHEHSINVYPTVKLHFPGVTAAPGEQLYPSTTNNYEQASPGFALNAVQAVLTHRKGLAELYAAKDAANEASAEAMIEEASPGGNGDADDGEL